MIYFVDHDVEDIVDYIYNIFYVEYISDIFYQQREQNTRSTTIVDRQSMILSQRSTIVDIQDSSQSILIQTKTQIWSSIKDQDLSKDPDLDSRAQIGIGIYRYESKIHIIEYTKYILYRNLYIYKHLFKEMYIDIQISIRYRYISINQQIE